MPAPTLSSRLLLLTVVLFILAIATYYQRSPTGDDAWFAEESYWLLKEGNVRSEFFRGLLKWEEHYLVSHKLFIGTGALLTALFPNSLYGVKLSGLLFFAGLIALMRYAANQKRPASFVKKDAVLYLLILVFANTLLVNMSFENRPELMVAAFGFSSFLLLKPNGGDSGKSAAAGSFAGLAVLSHLNGIIFIGAGLLTLLLLRQYKQTLIFGLSAGLVSSFYFYDVSQTPDGFSLWWFQFRNDPATQNAFGWIEKIKVMVSFPAIFFESPEQQSASVLLAAVGWWKRKQLNNLDKKLIIYLLSLLFSFWIITKRASGIYEVLFLPFMFVLIVELLFMQSPRPVPMYVKIACAFYLIVGTVGNGQLIHRNLSGYLPDQYAALRIHIPARTAGLVPLTFFFNEYGRYPTLLCHTNFDLQMLQRKEKADSKGFFNWAASNNSRFVLIDYQQDRADYYPAPGTPAVEKYRLSFFDGRFAVYRFAGN